MKKTACIFSALALSACATPEVVDIEKTSDQSLTCEQIAVEIDEAKAFEKSAREEKGVTGTNVAAALFFFPGLLATYANADEAIDAARDRQQHLFRLSEEQGC